MCTCIEDLYWAEIRLPLGPTVLFGIAGMLVYSLSRYLAISNVEDDVSVFTDTEYSSSAESYSEPDDVSDDVSEDEPDIDVVQATSEPDIDAVQATSEPIFPEDYDRHDSLIDAPVKSSTEEALSDTAPQWPEIDGTPSESSLPDDA